MYTNYLNKFAPPRESRWVKKVQPFTQSEWKKEQLADQCPEDGELEITAEKGGPIYEIFRAMRMDLMAEAKALGIETPLADSLEGQVKGFLHKLLPKLETPKHKRQILNAFNKTLQHEEYFPITVQQLKNAEMLTSQLVEAISRSPRYRHIPEGIRFSEFLVDVKCSGALSADHPLTKERGNYVLPKLYVSPLKKAGGCWPRIQYVKGNPVLYNLEILLGKQFIKGYSINRIIDTLTHEMRHAQQYMLGVNLEVIPEFEGKGLDFTGRPEDFVKAYKTAQYNDPERFALICKAMEVDAEMYKAKIMGGIYSYLEGGYYNHAKAGTHQNKIAQPTRKQMIQGEERLEQTMRPIMLVGPQEEIDGTSQRLMQVLGIDVPTRLECMGYRPATEFGSHAERAAARSTTTANPTRGA